jgi:hypothetical protein
MAGTVVASTINTDTGVFQTNNALTGCAKAWVYFNGSTGAVNGTAFNVSSVTRSGAGQYTINFTTAMSSANYAVSASNPFVNGSAPYGNVVATVTNSTGSVYIQSYGSNNGGSYDSTTTSVIIFSV